jgi:hypothetical protein
MSAAISVDVRRTGKCFDASATLDLPAELPAVWATITTYDALPRFMPGIRQCNVVEHGGADDSGVERMVLHQIGEFRLLLLSQRIDVTLDVRQQPMHWAEARARSFDVGVLKVRALDAFEGRYDLKPHTARGKPRVQVLYTARIVLRVPPPPAIGSAAVRQNLRAQLQAIEREVARRMAGGR